jgi:hypothetical protein
MPVLSKRSDKLLIFRKPLRLVRLPSVNSSSTSPIWARRRKMFALAPARISSASVGNVSIPTAVNTMGAVKGVCSSRRDRSAYTKKSEKQIARTIMVGCEYGKRRLCQLDAGSLAVHVDFARWDRWVTVSQDDVCAGEDYERLNFKRSSGSLQQPSRWSAY